MYTEDDVTKVQKEMTIKFFKNNFLGKNPNEALYNVMRDGILDIATTLGRFIIIKICLQAIVDDKPYFDKLDTETQSFITNCKLGVEDICESLDRILTPIVQSLREQRCI